METKIITKLFTDFDAIKKVDEDGYEYWIARELQKLLGYSKWENFSGVIRKAIVSCQKSGIEAESQFFLIPGKTSELGGRPKEDYELSRYACYLIAQRGVASGSRFKKNREKNKKGY